MEFLGFAASEIKEIGIQPLWDTYKIERIMESDCIAMVDYYRGPYIKEYNGKEDIIRPNFLIKKTDFLDMNRDLFKKIGFSDYMTEKYLWLQKYLKGEVSGKFEKENAEIQAAVYEACEKKDKEIEKLRKKIDNLMLENENVKEENRELKRTIKSNEKFYDKMKLLQEQLLKIEL